MGMKKSADSRIISRHPERDTLPAAYLVDAMITRGGAAVGYKVHNRNRIKLHGQHLHGDFTELFGLFVHFPLLEFIGSVYLEGGKSLQVSRKVSPKAVYCPQYFDSNFLPTAEPRRLPPE